MESRFRLEPNVAHPVDRMRCWGHCRTRSSACGPVQWMIPRPLNQKQKAKARTRAKRLPTLGPSLEGRAWPCIQERPSFVRWYALCWKLQEQVNTGESNPRDLACSLYFLLASRTARRLVALQLTEFVRSNVDGARSSSFFDQRSSTRCYGARNFLADPRRVSGRLGVCDDKQCRRVLRQPFSLWTHARPRLTTSAV